MKRTSRGSKPIRQNRPNYRKEILGYKKPKNSKWYVRRKKIKGKNYEKVKGYEKAKKGLNKLKKFGLSIYNKKRK